MVKNANFWMKKYFDPNFSVIVKLVIALVWLVPVSTNRCLKKTQIILSMACICNYIYSICKLHMIFLLHEPKLFYLMNVHSTFCFRSLAILSFNLPNFFNRPLSLNPQNCISNPKNPKDGFFYGYKSVSLLAAIQ